MTKNTFQDLLAKHPAFSGIAAAIIAAFMMAAMSTAVKTSAVHIPNEMVVFLRNAFGLLFLSPALIRVGPSLLKTHRFPEHLGRSLFGLAAMYCFFYAIAHMPLAEAVLLNFSSPVFTAIFATLWLKEPLTRYLLGGILIGLVGVVLILKPGPGLWSSAAPVGVISAVCAGLAMTHIRSMADTEPTLRIVLYFAIIGTLTSALPLTWAWQTPPTAALLSMAAAGLFASMGQVALTYSYSQLPAAQVGAMSYTTVIFAALFGWLLWRETPDLMAAGGAALIVSAGVLASTRSPLEELD